ncbi:MAG: hypothetical protein EX260_01360 [Desulfobulbaceae bacterium]|nr:hypothetical protein [Desulfofustis sp.]NNK58110.1 hypothetical protein [Desulfofustis sp.]RZW26365.1 MAG: hypothetical protein EX260_01360 [Desulfobulbaceae bacterium]
MVLIWLVQIIIYPGMHGWDQARFAQLHKDYATRISFIVGPLMLGQAALALHQLVTAPGGTAIMQTLLIGAVWGVTIFISVPLHRRLSDGYEEKNVNRLVTTNWLRTLCWSLVFLLDMLILVSA